MEQISNDMQGLLSVRHFRQKWYKYRYANITAIKSANALKIGI